MARYQLALALVQTDLEMRRDRTLVEIDFEDRLVGCVALPFAAIFATSRFCAACSVPSSIMPGVIRIFRWVLKFAST